MITLHETVAPGLECFESARVATLSAVAARPGGRLKVTSTWVGVKIMYTFRDDVSIVTASELARFMGHSQCDFDVPTYG